MLGLGRLNTPTLTTQCIRRQGLLSRAVTVVAGPEDADYRRGGDFSRRPERGAANNRKKSSKGGLFEKNNRRKGRPAWQRSPDDTPLRDGNRDRLMGLLTERATKTLIYYFQELNPTLHMWLTVYLKDNPIPRDGNWDDVSGETFLRNLLTMPIAPTKFDIGRPDMYDCTGAFGVNPREIATRIMSIRSEIAKEWIQELKGMSEENSLLMRETLVNSLSLEALLVADPAEMQASHPELRHPDFDFTDNSSFGGDD